jgi:hypothetical protein
MSAANGRIIFSAYENDGYSIYALETAEQLAGRAPVELPINAGVLPPRRTGQGPVFTTITNMTRGLPPAATPEQAPAEPYKPKLSLDFVGQPTVAVGADSFGAYAAGGVAFMFSDMLGNHTVSTAVQATSRFDEFGAQVQYVNRTHRWNWGTSVQQIPYVARAFDAGIATVDGETRYVENEYRILQRDQAVLGLLAYPISRSQRVELTGGLRRIGLKEDVTTRTFDVASGTQLSRERNDLSNEPTINLGQASAALVYDTSIFGLTSPIRGSRYRFELSQNSGSLTFSSALGDVRTYLMPVRPFTFAMRGLFFGRYGSDAGDGRLPTLDLGYPGLVRGYESSSFESGECGLQTDGSCPVFDRLIGSRLALASAEFRFPLWGAFKRDQFYGPVPVEIGFFGDVGTAWGTNPRTLTTSSDREPVASAGVLARVNILGFAVAEIDYVRPFNRPGRGWLWQFNLIPGF